MKDGLQLQGRSPDPRCRFITLQGPPGTGKSHTITAIAFDCIQRQQSCLVLSDKTEALDVVEDKLSDVLSIARGGDDDFPKSHSSYWQGWRDV